MENLEGLRFASYMRASTNKQDGSQERQRRDIEEWAENTGACVIEWYYDEVSGSRLFEKRPGGKGLIQAARDKRIDAVVIESLSRLGRNPLDVILTLGRLTGLGLGDMVKTMEFFSLKIFELSSRRFIDMDNDSDRLLVWMTAAAMDIERSKISARVQSNNRLRRSKGGDIGAPKYGYTWGPNGKGAAIHVPDMSFRYVIQAIFELNEMGHTKNEIIEKLSDLSDTLPKRKRITKHKIDSIRKHKRKYVKDFKLERPKKKVRFR